MEILDNEKRLEAIDAILKGLVDAPNSFLSGERVTEIAGSEQAASIIRSELINEGSAVSPKYQANKNDLNATELTEIHYTTGYHRNKSRQVKGEEKKIKDEKTKLELEIKKLKRDRWVTYTALAISILSLSLTLLSRCL